MGVNPIDAIQNLEKGVLKSIAPDENAWGKVNPPVQSELEIETSKAEQEAEVSEIPVTEIENDIRATQIVLADMNQRHKELQFIRDAKRELAKKLKGAVI